MSVTGTGCRAWCLDGKNHWETANRELAVEDAALTGKKLVLAAPIGARPRRIRGFRLFLTREKDFGGDQWPRLSTRHLPSILEPYLGATKSAHILSNIAIPEVSRHALGIIDLRVTYLHFFLSKSDSIHNLDSCGLVGFGVLLVFRFENGMILGAATAVSKQGFSCLILCGFYLVRRRLCRVSRWSSTSGGVFLLTESCECTKNANWPPWPADLTFIVAWDAGDGGVLFVRSMVTILRLEQTIILGLPLLS